MVVECVTVLCEAEEIQKSFVHLRQESLNWTGGLEQYYPVTSYMVVLNHFPHPLLWVSDSVQCQKGRVKRC